MYHTIESYNDLVTKRSCNVTFNTKDITYITVNIVDGKPTVATLGLNHFNENGDQAYYTFASRNNQREKEIVQQLFDLASNLEQISSYFVDEDGTVICFDKVMMVEPTTLSVILEGNIRVKLCNTSSHRAFKTEYCNYMDTKK